MVRSRVWHPVAKDFDRGRRPRRKRSRSGVCLCNVLSAVYPSRSAAVCSILHGNLPAAPIDARLPIRIWIFEERGPSQTLTNRSSYAQTGQMKRQSTSRRWERMLLYAIGFTRLHNPTSYKNTDEPDPRDPHDWMCRFHIARSRHR